MKALLTKDFFVLYRQMGWMLVMIMFFSLFPSSYLNLFAMAYGAMLPYSTIAYDERSKWDRLAAMLPYSTRDIVLSKYVLGWISTAGLFLLSLLGRLVVRMLPFAEDPVVLQVMLMGASAAIISMDITLPIMFRFGVEKGRMGILLLIGLICGSAGALSHINDAGVSGAAMLLAVILPLAALVCTAVSVPLSVRMYRRRSV